MSDKNFGYLGYKFQISLLNLLIEDKQFSTSIMDVIDPKYFDNQYFKLIAQMIKEYYKKYETSPSYDALEQMTRLEVKQAMPQKNVIDTIKDIRKYEVKDPLFTQEKATKFCKQQELGKAMVKVKKLMDEGDFENYEKAEQFIREALQVGEKDLGTQSVFDHLNMVLEDDYRHPIPMGITGIDNLLNGGLAKGELGVILAPTGVGKSTVLTKIANTAYNQGYNVLQIFFEDNPKIIQRKHFTLWTGISPDDLSDNKDKVFEKLEEVKSNKKNKLILKKLPSDTMSLSQIKNQVRKIIAEGTKIDVIVLDYIDCIAPEKSNGGDEWKSEGSVMRQFEAMCYEFNVTAWTATQGNRCVSLDTYVDIKDKGHIQIKDVEKGDMIMTHKGYKNITHIFPIEKQPVYRIKTKSGKVIKVSSKHKFPTKDGLKSIQSGLAIGDKLFVSDDYKILNEIEELEIDEIESIELIGEEDTIDITVDDTHMFYANGIYTHNSSISSEVVTTDQMGGSIKKAQVGHVIISVAKTLQQKELGLATIAITKSRLGKDGVIFENCKFDNEMLEIDTEQTNTFLGFEEDKEKKRAERVRQALQRRQQVINNN